MGDEYQVEILSVAARELILESSEYDLNRVIADLEEIRRYNLQRFEMEQLTAICYLDEERQICVGYKDVTPDEFWCRGHMPGMPLMPGVVMCEAAAQMCSFYVQKRGLMGTRAVGFGGLDEVKFRGPVRPGSRLVLVCQLTKARPNVLIMCRFQGLVDDVLVVEGVMKGVPLPKEFTPPA